MLKKNFLFCFLTVITFALTACGFHLRGHNDLPPELHKIYLQTDNPYGSLETHIQQTLRSAGVILVNNAQEAPIILKLSNPTKTDTGASVGPSSQARVYTQSYAITFTLLNAQGKTLAGPQTLSTSRNLILNANQLPQSNNQVDVLYQEMERDIVNQLYNRLRSKQVLKALQ